MDITTNDSDLFPNQLIQYLESKLPEFQHLWEKRLIIYPNDIHKHKVADNGLLMYTLIKKTIKRTITEDQTIALAYKVAQERIEANINIGDFVYNVNLGRSILVKYIIHSGIAIKELQPIIDRVNAQFDQFCYHAVSRYTDLKNQDLQDKILFINQTHKDKLSILGQISSSFVHEFRNPLTSVMGFIKILKSENPEMKYFDIIQHELDELNFRITQFLHTSKMEIKEKTREEISPATLFDELLNFLYPSIVDVDLLVSTEIDPEINIFVFKDEIKQVLLNILYNSIDALRTTKKPRKIFVQAVKEKNQVILNISNNGPRIPVEIQETIFEPFYTTKELGTGIGLYVCKKIIENHNGTISCKSNEQLTTFSLGLPVSSPE